jgi:hypothetical protein
MRRLWKVGAASLMVAMLLAGTAFAALSNNATALTSYNGNTYSFGGHVSYLHGGQIGFKIERGTLSGNTQHNTTQCGTGKCGNNAGTCAYYYCVDAPGAPSLSHSLKIQVYRDYNGTIVPLSLTYFNHSHSGDAAIKDDTDIVGDLDCSEAPIAGTYYYKVQWRDPNQSAVAAALTSLP